MIKSRSVIVAYCVSFIVYGSLINILILIQISESVYQNKISTLLFLNSLFKRYCMIMVKSDVFVDSKRLNFVFENVLYLYLKKTTRLPERSSSLRT